MKRIEIIVDTEDEYKEVKKSITKSKFDVEYEAIEIHCNDLNTSVTYKPILAEKNDLFIYYKSNE